MTIKELICESCIHYNELGFGCKAFPEGIPNEILDGSNKHTKPLPEQLNDLVYQKA